MNIMPSVKAVHASILASCPCLHLSAIDIRMQASTAATGACMKTGSKDESKVAGAVARAASLSPDERRAIAEKAAAARWGGKAYTASHKGNFQKHFGIPIECYVLND